MVAEDLFNLFDRFGPTRYVGLEDVADKMSFLYSVIILLISTFIVSIKSYVFKSIACYLPVSPASGDFEGYMENYCWVHGTVPMDNGYLPEDPSQWGNILKNNGVSYYQWVPFVLGLQTILFYLPRFLWQIICFNSCGTDLDNIMKQSVDISLKPFSERDDEYKSIAGVISDTLYLHRDFRYGKKAEISRKISDKFNFFLPSKRLGTKLTYYYLMIKILYLINIIGQMFLIQKFLGYKENLLMFGWRIIEYILSGAEWQVKNYFPRVTFCNVPQIRHVGSRNSFTAQCVLPVNMLNEKIYIFLWFWIVLVLLFAILSFPVWLTKVFIRRNRFSLIKKYLRMHRQYSESKRELINTFITNFLRHDGIFLIMMIKNNAGDVVSSHISCELWNIFLNCYKDRNFCYDIEYAMDSRNCAIQLEHTKTNATKYKNDEMNHINDGDKINLYNNQNNPIVTNDDLNNSRINSPTLL